MTRPAWYVELMTMLLIELSDHIAFLDFLDSWIFGIGSFIILLCNGYMGIISHFTKYRP